MQKKLAARIQIDLLIGYNSRNTYHIWVPYRQEVRPHEGLDDNDEIDTDEIELREVVTVLHIPETSEYDTISDVKLLTQRQ